MFDINVDNVFVCDKINIRKNLTTIVRMGGIMKIKFIKILACFTMIFSLFGVPIKAEHDSLTLEEITKISNAVKNQVFDIEEIVINIESIDILYDIEMNPTYVYVVTDTGYFILTRENCAISEGVLDTQELPYAELSNEQIPVYAGPLSYQIIDNTAQIDDEFTISEESIEKNRVFLNSTIEDEMFSDNYIPEYLPLYEKPNPVGNWVGKDESIMKKYSSGDWINDYDYNINGICGTIVSAVLLAYNDDYIDNGFVDDNVRKRSSSGAGSLIDVLYNYIDKGKNGTIATDLTSGLNNYFLDYQKPYNKYKANGVLTGTFTKVKAAIDNSQPAAVGMPDFLYPSDGPENYGGHWVVAYQYNYKNSTAGKFYKVVDNHGKYNAIINVGWTAGAAWMVR